MVKNPIGPLFWRLMLQVPLAAAMVAFVLAAAFRSAQEQLSSFDELCVASAEIFLLVIFSITSMQAYVYEWWSANVEGYLGMPPWVHKGGGALELFIVLLRLSCGFRAGPLAALFGASSKSLFAARCCGVAEVLTAGMMGGALWTWPFGVYQTIGVIPALCVIVSSAASSHYWLHAASKRPGTECAIWHMASFAAAAVGATVAEKIFEWNRRKERKRR
eukprot:TRINITY_DN62775_c0_g1_i1.p1 TRINITY_DN62775_c0_g1~~TRINITY_DN62775_c0_g1_i1.p1  ORF type:complete len:218 (-),score=30.98 TRINITY_DN62775_c0_g1_i1:29-682(-)